MPRKEGHLLVDGKKRKDIEYPFEHGEVINYTLDGVSIHPVTTKIQASFLTQLPERKETVQGFHHEANGDFKTVTEFNGCDRRRLRMAQQHCSYSGSSFKSCVVLQHCLCAATKFYGTLFKCQILLPLMVVSASLSTRWHL